MQQNEGFWLLIIPEFRLQWKLRLFSIILYKPEKIWFLRLDKILSVNQIEEF